MDNEFDLANYSGRDPHNVADMAFSSRLNIGRGPSNASGFATPSEVDAAALNPEIPLLTFGQEVVICNRLNSHNSISLDSLIYEFIQLLKTFGHCARSGPLCT